jgi:hypothetical protein
MWSSRSRYGFLTAARGRSSHRADGGERRDDRSTSVSTGPGRSQNVIVGTRSCNDIEQSTATHYDPVRGWPTDPQWATNDAEHLANAMLAKVKV